MVERLAKARTVLSAEVAENSLRLVAKRVGINHNTLAEFLDGTVKRPRTPARTRILAYVEQRPGTSGTETAPSMVEGAERAAELTSAAARSVDYWIGKQEGLLEVMKHVSSLQRYVTGLQQQAAEMQDKAIAMQQQIIAHTSPTPVPPQLAAPGAQAVLENAARGKAKKRGRGGQKRSDDGQPSEAP